MSTDHRFATIYEMDISYLGHSAFKIKTKTATVITDPYDPKIVGFSYPKVEAEIVTISHHLHDHDYTERVTGIKKIIDGPGEYEVMEVSIIGISTLNKNTIYVIEAEGLRLAHLGDLGQKLSQKEIEELGGIDILMVPVGGTHTLGPKEAFDVVQQIEPILALPMHYGPAMDLAPVDDFLKTSGMAVEKMNKLTVKVDTLGEAEKIILLSR